MRATHHLIYSLDNSQHLIITNLPIAIDIIKLKRPVELILHLATRRNRQRADELFEIDHATVIRVEDAKDVVCEGRRIPEGEELPVYLLELLLGEGAGGAVF